ncbi:MAG: hypothetical protein HQ562_04495 [Candidatus Marinimicrobia bacterium]|nr:hypothetical protein [Candidatus Neomarinimicrobiota bacterium]
MEPIPLILSVILNIILVVVIFFKSSLNDIVANWWSNRKAREKERKELLIKMRSKFIHLTRISFLILIRMGVLKMEDNQINRNVLMRNSEQTLVEWQEINDFMVENEVHLPQSARSLYQSFSEMMRNFNGEILSEGPYRDRILEMHSELSVKIDEIVQILENELD